jgi:hypothetical protein
VITDSIHLTIRGFLILLTSFSDDKSSNFHFSLRWHIRFEFLSLDRLTTNEASPDVKAEKSFLFLQAVPRL